MVSSAIYRYFPSRDELLTTLIIESYERLGEAVESAERAVRRRSDFAGRWRAAAYALRTWAIDHPSEWTLLFGTPVPGYAAPQTTIPAATRYTAVLLSILSEMAAAGHSHRAAVPKALRADIARLRRDLGTEFSDATMTVGMNAWAAVMGSINLELFGHLHNVVNQPGALFEAVVEQHAMLITA